MRYVHRHCQLLQLHQHSTITSSHCLDNARTCSDSSEQLHLGQYDNSVLTLSFINCLLLTSLTQRLFSPLTYPCLCVISAFYASVVLQSMHHRPSGLSTNRPNGIKREMRTSCTPPTLHMGHGCALLFFYITVLTANKSMLIYSSVPLHMNCK